jgi:hypothetical protein
MARSSRTVRYSGAPLLLYCVWRPSRTRSSATTAVDAYHRIERLRCRPPTFPLFAQVLWRGDFFVFVRRLRGCSNVEQRRRRRHNLKKRSTPVGEFFHAVAWIRSNLNNEHALEGRSAAGVFERLVEPFCEVTML